MGFTLPALLVLLGSHWGLSVESSSGSALGIGPSRASLPSLSSLTVTVVLGSISSFPKDVPDGSNWSVASANSNFVFLIGTYEMPSRSFSMIWRFSRKTHKRLRSVFFLPVSRIVLLSVLGAPCFSNDFSQISQFFFCSSVELRTFLLKNSVFLAAAYLKKCFLADSAGFFHLLLLRYRRWEEWFPHFSLGCPQNSRVFFFSTPTPLVLLLGLKVYEVRNVFTPNPSRYDQYRWRGGELFIDVVPGDGSDSRAFLKPELVRVSRTNLK